MSTGTRPFQPRAFLVATWAVNVCINAFYISPAPVFPTMIDELGTSGGSPRSGSSGSSG